jgi:hypothetical protein
LGQLSPCLFLLDIFLAITQTIKITQSQRVTQLYLEFTPILESNRKDNLLEKKPDFKAK